MEDVSHPAQSDNEQPHPQVNHSRPFFYVQPPSQPYFMYQWPMDPYGQYGFPGPVFPFGRPYVPPYQFMQYPGYMVPHAPMQPTDYRRMAPVFPSVASYDLRFRQHFQQMSMHRETTSSEAQTEPGDPVSKLMDCLEGLQACEKAAVVREANVMFSSTPAVISFTHEVDKINYGDNELNKDPVSHLDKVNQDGSEKPGTLCDSAVYDAESSQGHLEECVLSDVLPLDSSSVRDESREQDYKRGDLEMLRFQREKSDTCVSSGNRSPKVQDSGAYVSNCNEMSDLCVGMSTLQSEKVQNLLPESVEVTEPLLQMIADSALPYQILRLPCNKTTTGLLLHKEVDPLLYMDPESALLPPKQYPFGSSYTHNYYPQVVPERQSVLSPSLDELSSRDEMFSTDVEDDLVSGQTYVDAGKLAETGAVHTQMDPSDNSFSVWAKTCSCCGASLPDEDVGPAEPLDQDCSCELENNVAPINGDGQKVLRRHGLSPCAPVSKHKAKKVLEVAESSEQDQDHGRGECGEQNYCPAKADKGRGKGPKGTHFRSYSEHLQRESPGEMIDQENWAGCSGQQRSRSCRPSNGLQEKGRPTRRRPSCKTFAHQRPRRNEYDDHNEAEFSYCQRGRGSMKRRGTRY